MASAPRKHNYRFTFGPWNISTGEDPFGPAARKEVAFASKIREYKKLGFDGVQLHDDDAVEADLDPHSAFLGDTEFTWHGRVFRRRIPLFRDPGGVTALKTGFTLAAGYNVTVAAGRAGHRLLCVILGAETRGLSFLDAGRLLRFGFGEPAPASRPVKRHVRPRVRAAS